MNPPVHLGQSASVLLTWKQQLFEAIAAAAAATAPAADAAAATPAAAVAAAVPAAATAAAAPVRRRR